VTVFSVGLEGSDGKAPAISLQWSVTYSENPRLLVLSKVENFLRSKSAVANCGLIEQGLIDAKADMFSNRAT
jgi:hypothetical protein